MEGLAATLHAHLMLCVIKQIRGREGILTEANRGPVPGKTVQIDRGGHGGFRGQSLGQQTGQHPRIGKNFSETLLKKPFFRGEGGRDSRP